MAGYLGNTQKISGSYTVDEFTSSGGTTYTLTKTPGAKNNIQVSAGGLVQYPSAYSVSGTTLTLSGVPSGQKVVVRHMGDTIPYPTLADDAVTSAKIANDAVTGAKLNPALVAGDVIYADGTDTINRLAKGTAAQVLTMNAGATAPEWAAAAGGVDGITSSANATAMTISADEEVNMPLQPSFRARRTTMMNNVTGINALSVVDIIFDVEDWDIGSNYNTSNGTFTAPITGKYFLTFGGVYLTGFTFNNTSVTGQIFTSNRMHRSHQTSIWEQSGGAYSMTINGSAVADMEVGDTAKVQCGASGNSSGQTVDVYADGSYTSNGYTWFAGWLLG